MNNKPVTNKAFSFAASAVVAISIFSSVTFAADDLNDQDRREVVEGKIEAGLENIKQFSITQLANAYVELMKFQEKVGSEENKAALVSAIGQMSTVIESRINEIKNMNMIDVAFIQDTLDLVKNFQKELKQANESIDKKANQDQ